MKNKSRKTGVTIFLVFILSLLNLIKAMAPDQLLDKMMEDARINDESNSFERMWEADFNNKPYTTKSPPTTTTSWIKIDSLRVDKKKIISEMSERIREVNAPPKNMTATTTPPPPQETTVTEEAPQITEKPEEATTETAKQKSEEKHSSSEAVKTTEAPEHSSSEGGSTTTESTEKKHKPKIHHGKPTNSSTSKGSKRPLRKKKLHPKTTTTTTTTEEPVTEQHDSEITTTQAPNEEEQETTPHLKIKKTKKGTKGKLTGAKAKRKITTTTTTAAPPVITTMPTEPKAKKPRRRVMKKKVTTTVAPTTHKPVKTMKRAKGAAAAKAKHNEMKHNNENALDKLQELAAPDAAPNLANRRSQQTLQNVALNQFSDNKFYSHALSYNAKDDPIFDSRKSTHSNSVDSTLTQYKDSVLVGATTRTADQGFPGVPF